MCVHVHTFLHVHPYTHSSINENGIYKCHNSTDQHTKNVSKTTFC